MGEQDRADAGNRLAAGESQQGIGGLLRVLAGPDIRAAISAATTGVQNDVPLHVAIPRNCLRSPTGGSWHT